VTATANSGYNFVNWTQNGSVFSTSASDTFTVNSNVTLVANFAATPSTALFPAMGSQARSVYPWAQYPPGVTYNGGIPNRTTQCGPTLTPLGGGQDDAPQIQAAINKCPSGQVVQLGAGVFTIANTSQIKVGPPFGPAVNHITIQGVGPGPGGAIPDNYTAIPTESMCGSTPCTILFKNGWQNSGSVGTLWINLNGSQNGFLDTPINLASDAVQGSKTITLASAPSGADWAPGRLALISILSADPNNPPSYVYNNNPDLWFGGNFVACEPACFGWYSQPYRAMQQLVKIVSVSGNVVTIDSPLSYSYTVAYQAQMVTYNSTQPQDIGVQDIYFYGGGGGNGNVSIEMCDSCWIRHIESHWASGSVGIVGCYRCELRDSYIHENGQGNGITGLPVNGGGSYLLSIDRGTSNSLVENNILLVGDKPEVMRATGGGNVVAYNYMDDQWDIGEPPAAEAGLNAGHYGVSHFDLMEGNRTHHYSGDSLWGNAIYITVFRNWLVGIREGNYGLATYVNNLGYAWCDCASRNAVEMQAYSYYHNLVGNVLGFKPGSSGVTLQPVLPSGLLPAMSGTSAQTSFAYENLSATVNANATPTMWQIGNSTAAPGPDTSQPNLYQQVNRQGNFDWVTQSQIWYASYGGSGTTSTGSPMTLPNSLYLTSKPAFFGTMTWPWVDPSTGTVYTLPAKARWDAGTPNTAVGGAAPLQ
jgi:hypothetical protein